MGAPAGGPFAPVGVRRSRRAALALAGAASILVCAGGLGCAHAGSTDAEAAAAARQAVIESNMGELQSCWDDLAPAHPGVSGSLLFNVELRRNGSVEWVDIGVDELGVAKLGACTVRQIKKWRFPEDRKRRSISFGVGFASPGAAP